MSSYHFFPESSGILHATAVRTVICHSLRCSPKVPSQAYERRDVLIVIYPLQNPASAVTVGYRSSLKTDHPLSPASGNLDEGRHRPGGLVQTLDADTAISASTAMAKAFQCVVLPLASLSLSYFRVY